MLRDLKWLGLDWDEGTAPSSLVGHTSRQAELSVTRHACAAAGPDVGGSHGPYRQTERKETYMKYVDQMIRANQAYPCFCTDEELEDMRKSAEAEGRPPVYSGALCCHRAQYSHRTRTRTYAA